MKTFFSVISVLLLCSCIPLKIAPNLKQGKILKTRKFIKKLPSQYTYVFEDPKDANEFYNYINAKYQTSYDDETGNLPVTISNKTCYLSFYEVNKETQTVNLIPMVIDAALNQNGSDPILESAYTSRQGTWYIALTIIDEAMNDCFNPAYEGIIQMTKYAQGLQEEYLSTTEYIEVYLKGS